MASTAAAASSSDRLSHLSDDILTHILSFAPSREAARATALSRRWRRPLWLNTGVVNIDYRSYLTGGVPLRRRAVDDADHAFACLCSGGRVPKKLSMVMPDDVIVCAACNDDGEGSNGVEEEEEESADVEDPRLEWLNNGGLPHCTLAFAVLKVLELTGYELKPYSDERRELAFPCLEAMRLRRCRTELDTLQEIISAAPRLADVRLESLSFMDHEYVYNLKCEAATVIVIENCFYSVALEAPDLRRFHYAHFGFLDEYTSVSFEWPLPQLEHLHLAVHSASWGAAYLRRRVLTNMRHLRYLKLTAYSIADLSDGFSQDFPNLESLEIEELCGWCIRNHGAAATVVVNLLRKCPILRDIRLKFSWRKYLRDSNANTADEMAAIADFAPCGSIGHDDEDEGECCGSDDLHEQLCCGCRLSCLRRVVVEFDADELTCFQVRLVKFLAKNGVALEEFIVDGGKGYDSSYIDRKVARWRKPRRLPRSLSPAAPPPVWPPPLSEFPMLEAPLCSADGEINDDDGVKVKEDLSLRHYHYSSEDEDYDDDISPRHYMHSGRKKKKGSCLECFSVKPKSKGSTTDGWRGTTAPRSCRYRRSDLEKVGGDSFGGLPMAAESLQPPMSTPESPAEPWSAPLLYEFPLLPRAPPPASRRPPLRQTPSAPARRPLSPPNFPLLDIPTLAVLDSTYDTITRGWRAVRLGDLGVDLATSRRCSHELPTIRHSPPAIYNRRFATFPGRPSRTMWRR